MKHHIAVKFLAILLATLSLLTVIASGLGIFCLAEAGLYNNTFDRVYEENMASTRREFAVNLAHRYASLNLGGLPEQYLMEYHGAAWLYNTFEFHKYCYQIRDEQGNIVEDTLFDDLTDATRYEILVTDISYRHRLTEEELSALRSGKPDDQEDPDATDPTLDPNELTEPFGDDYMTYGTLETSGTGDQTPIYRDGYYDPESSAYVEFFYCYKTIPAFTVELYLLPGALPDDALWSLLRTVWELRSQLFYALGIALLIFAAAAVYLICAAGRQPGSDTVRAGGLNRLPLDLYLVLGGGAEILLVALMASLTGICIQEAPQVLLPIWFLCGSVICLIFVGFFFALVAQLKTPGGYWWRRSITRLLLLKLWRGCKWLGRKCRKLLGGVKTMLSMMPLIWQWLLTAAIMAVLPPLTLLLMLACRSWDLLEIFFLLAFISSILGDIAMVCYGAYCFGILSKGARQIAQGDLDYQISTQYLFGCFRDFADQLNALAGAAQQAAARQLKSERMKTELITNVSHDIKTPLTSIINYVDLMQKPHSPQEGEMYLEVLSRQSLRLKKLVDDLMDMSKASTGNMTLEVSRVDAAEAINQALGEFSDKLTLAQLIPVFRPPEKPVYMMADGKLLWRVMSNLLSNAVKYALPGTRLYVDLERIGDRAVISLKNISREELNVSADELLERFVRGDASRNTEGSGLGLNIAQSLMELQHGSLQLLVDGDLFKVTLLFPAAD